MKILILGDIYGKAGRDAVASYLPFMKSNLKPDITIANAENVSEGGKGLTKYHYDYLSAAGVEYFTMGNHTFRNNDIYTYIDNVNNIVRPANLIGDEIKGKGFIIFKKNNKRILLFNLLGEAFITNLTSNPFQKADQILMECEGKYDLAILDMHAETTAEKIVMANYISEKVGIVFGTHTHIQTADERILNGRTAYITDVGMCGVFNSAIGADFEAVEARMSDSGRLTKFKEAKGPVRINAILVTLFENTLRPTLIERITINP